MTIDTGDVVRHVPTGEEWVVAFVRNGDLSWCGWPEGWAKISDCILIKKATAEERMKLLHEMAEMQGDQDHRARYARAELDLMQLSLQREKRE
jgi:hypothetical protein